MKLLEKEENWRVSMFNTKICIISSLIMIILTAIMSSISYYSSLKLEHTMMGQLFHLLFVILNVIIYFIYLNSNMNKLVGYFGALLTAIVCYIIQAFFIILIPILSIGEPD